MSTFSGIYNAKSALSAFQEALQVTGENTANSNTVGYSRKRVSFTDNGTYYGAGYSSGAGVSVQSVARVHDGLIQIRLNGNASDCGRSSTLNDQLSQVDALFSESSGAGISNDLATFFSAWSSLSSNPGQVSSQTQVLSSATTLASDIRNKYSTLSDQESTINGEITQTFKDIDQLTTQISKLNSEIRQAKGAGADSSDLEDQRDSAIQNLSKLVSIRTSNNADGTTTVYCDQKTLVDSQSSFAFPTTFSGSAQTVSDANGTYSVTGGKLAGYFQSINKIDGYKSSLDTLANQLRTTVNSLYQSGTNSSGTTGANFFNDSNPQTGAFNFDVDPALQNTPTAIASGVSGNSGDGALADQISQIASQTQASLGNVSLTTFYSNFVGQVGNDAAAATTADTTNSSVKSQINAQMQSVSGVSLDDELANMELYQRSYQAASKLLDTFSQLTQTIIDVIR